MKTAGIIFIYLGILTLFCESFPVEKQIRDPNFDGFVNIHSLDPNVDIDYYNWGQVEWTNWMVKRFGQIPPGRHVHTVLIATRKIVEYYYSFHNPSCRGPDGNDRFWSSSPFPTVVLQKDKSNQLYNVLICGNMFILAGLSYNALPVHLESQKYHLDRFNQSINAECQPFDFCKL